MKAEQSLVHRIVTASFGLLLIALAIAIIVVVDPPGIGSISAALLLAVLGAYALIAALRNRIPLLARIGPLP